MLKSYFWKQNDVLRTVMTTNQQKVSNIVGSTKPLSLFARYDNHLANRPLLTKCITSALIGLSADLLCQIVFSKEFAAKKYDEIKVDWRRTLQFTAIGGLFVAPVSHFWYGFILRTVPGTALVPVLKRLFLDQFCCAPIFLPCFFSLALTLEGTPEAIPSKLQKDWFPTLLTNYVVWIPAQFINFKFNPPRFHVLFANFVGFFWSIYLSYSCYNVDTQSGEHTPTIREMEESVIHAHEKHHSERLEKEARVGTGGVDVGHIIADSAKK